MPKKRAIIIISGPSGVGKGTLINSLLKKNMNLSLAVSACTRAPRQGEVHGENYYFVSREHFKESVEKGLFLEWFQVHQDYYGTLKSEVDSIFESDHDVILEIDTQGAKQVSSMVDSEGLLSIFILPPSLQHLKGRLQNRNTEDDAAIQFRLENAKVELEAIRLYDYVIINEDLDDTLQKLVEIIQEFRDN